MGDIMKKLLTSTRIAPWALIAGVAMGTFGAVQARADSTDELLELLKRKGALTKKEYAVIKSRHAAEKAAGSGPYITGEGGPPPRYVTALDKGIGIRLPLPGIGVGVTKGEVPVASYIDVSISGNLNAFYVQQFGSTKRGLGGRTAIGGGLVDGSKNSSAVRGGLLPAAVILDIATKQEGFDISGTLGFYTGINNTNSGFLGNTGADSVGAPKSLGTPFVNVKLAYAKIGTQNMGTFEFGRDFGLFGQDILTFDQNELAVGLPGSGDGGNLTPGQNALGQLGLGYIVSDFVPQFRYTTPNYNGFSATFAVETPYDATGRGTVGATTGGGGPTTLVAVPGGLVSNAFGASAHDQPQFAGRLKYVGNLLPNAMLTAWAGATTQELEGLRSAKPVIVNGVATGANAILRGGHTAARAYAAEAGAKLDIGAAELIGYGYYGHGAGTTALFFDGLDNRGDPRNSYGFLAQASYTFFDRLTIAGGYGISYLEHTKFDAIQAQLLGNYAAQGSALANAPFGTSNNVKYNASYIGTARYKVTKWLNLVAQYAHGRSKSLAGTRIDSDAAIGGAQIFF